MALDILNAKKVEANGLLSKIQIGGKVYEIKDLIARENVEGLSALLDALSAKVGNVADGQNLADIIKNIQENAYDDTAIQNAIQALQAADELKADKTQVATDIATAVKAEADIARAAEKANADEIARVDAALAAAIENDGEGLDSIKELATWIETHGPEATAMSEAITENANAIAAMDVAYKAADEAIDGRLDLIETALGDGEGSVSDQIADAKAAAVADAKSYTDGEINKLGDLAKKNEADLNLKTLAHKDSATGTVAGQTISGVKATGTSTGSINVALEQTEHAMNSTGKFTPAGNVTGSVKASGSVAVTVSTSAADATLTKGDYTPAGSVSVALSGDSFNAITGVGTQASFQEGAFTAATLDYAPANYNVAKEGIVGSVDDNETLVFTAAGLEAISASKINGFTGGSKAADTFVANSLPTMTPHQVGVQSASFTGTLAEDLVVTNVSYAKANAEAAATFTGDTNDIAATFAGTEGDITVAGTCHDYAVKTAEFNGAAIELAVGDIVVAEKNVTVQ